MKVIMIDRQVQMNRTIKSIMFMRGPNLVGKHSYSSAVKLNMPITQNVSSTGPNTMYMYSAVKLTSLSKVVDISSQQINPIVKIRVTTAELIE